MIIIDFTIVWPHFPELIGIFNVMAMDDCSDFVANE
jgi:hypothetical protein